MKKFLHITAALSLVMAASAAVPALSKQPIAMANGSNWAAPPNFSSHGPMIQNMKDGSEFVDRMLYHADQLKDYSCEFEITVFKKPSGITNEKGKLHFKKPRMMRSEETGDFHNGAVVVLRKDGKARAHYGGALKFFTVTVSPDDSRLLASNGYPMKDSDFVSLATYLKNWLSQGIKSRVTSTPVSVDHVPKPTYILEMYRAQDPNSVLKRIYIDPETNLPVRWDDHDYPNPSLSRWSDVKTNVGLNDDLFEM